ncbi:exodeoxyribonuclease III [Haloferula sp. A504]|uniref:exodeoxyribonuclease III n=1 Tax=Haloferula sp. A504 TaxID=3373601 RepID=UPI0031BC281F|nr:exodeoxyribonuclease III [Verrucomicrobiaceae bacterium E54]
MKLVSWNVNGIRACLGKGLGDFLQTTAPDVLCLQETKARPDQVQLPLEFGGYHGFWNSAEKPGYSGVAVFSRTEPLSVEVGMQRPEHDSEGRVITLEFDEFRLVNVYTPNAQNELRRLPYRMDWDTAFRAYLGELRGRGKPVIFCGDLNVAHREIDLARPAQNRRSAGFSDEEREGFTQLLDSGFIDSFRSFHPDLENAYSWWSYRGGARSRNVGWRIDYFGVDADMAKSMKSAAILAEVTGSDHCPVELTLK